MRASDEQCANAMGNWRKSSNMMSTPRPNEVITLQFMHFAINCFSWIALRPFLPCAFYARDIFLIVKKTQLNHFAVSFHRLHTTVDKIVIDTFCFVFYRIRCESIEKRSWNFRALARSIHSKWLQLQNIEATFSFENGFFSSILLPTNINKHGWLTFAMNKLY